jgi:ribosome-binding protein aMBF1 (putative translation factor)
MNQNNKNMEKIKLYTMNELLDRDLGPIGTPERDEFEQELADELHAYRVGEAIKKAREAQKLTQAELGERMGVQRSQVCRIESGKSITLASMMRAFRALGVQVALDMKGIGRLVL